MTVVVTDSGLQREIDVIDGELDMWLAVGKSRGTNIALVMQVSTELSRLKGEKAALLRDHNLQVAAVAGVATAAGSAVAPVLLSPAGRVGQVLRSGSREEIEALSNQNYDHTFFEGLPEIKVDCDGLKKGFTGPKNLFIALLSQGHGEVKKKLNTDVIAPCIGSANPIDVLVIDALKNLDGDVLGQWIKDNSTDKAEIEARRKDSHLSKGECAARVKNLRVKIANRENVIKEAVGLIVKFGTVARIFSLANEVLEIGGYAAGDCNGDSSDLLVTLSRNKSAIDEINPMLDVELDDLRDKNLSVFRHLPCEIVRDSGSAVDPEKLKVLWKYGCRRQFDELGADAKFVSALESLAAEDLFLRDGTDEDQNGISDPKVCEVLLRASVKEKASPTGVALGKLRSTLDSMTPSAVFQIAVDDSNKGASAEPEKLFSALDGSWFATAFNFDPSEDDRSKINGAYTNFFASHNQSSGATILPEDIVGYMIDVADPEDAIIQRLYKFCTNAQLQVTNPELLKLDGMGIIRMRYAIMGMDFSVDLFEKFTAHFASYAPLAV
jgi:hypothetical protein